MLDVWMNGEHVAAWGVDRGVHSLTYSDRWVASASARPLSLSLPITPSRTLRGPVIAAYFENLLPDNAGIRRRLARRTGARSIDAFDLLAQVGRDCVGAVQLMPEGDVPDGWDRVRSRTLTDADVAARLRAVPTLGMELADDEVRISIAGAQEKTALLRRNGRWAVPLGATPTTHILKLPLGLIGGSRRVDASDSVENEWLCAQILRELGLPVATTAMERFEDQSCLVVERFDRRWVEGDRWIARLPQEDCCQANGLPPERKYEQDGGPGMEACLRLFEGSEDAAGDVLAFQLAQLGFWILAATDGHAKNFSIFLRAGGRYEMTPLYDVLSMWPYFGERSSGFRFESAGLAMALRSKSKHYRLNTIQARHWRALAMKHGGEATWTAMLELKDGVDDALDRVARILPADFPARVWTRIARGARSQVKRFDAGLGALS